MQGAADVTNSHQGVRARPSNGAVNLAATTIVNHTFDSSIEQQRSFQIDKMKATAALILAGGAVSVIASAESARPRGVGPECMSSHHISRAMAV